MRKSLIKYFGHLLLFLFLVSCNPNQKLIEENERLKVENEIVINELEQLKEEALETAAILRAMEASFLEQREQAKVAVNQAEQNLGEALRQKQRADKLAIQLEACN